MKAVPALVVGICLGVAGAYGVLHFTNGGGGPDDAGKGGRLGAVGRGGLQSGAKEGAGGSGGGGVSGARFPKGVLADAALWAELEAGGERRKAALQGKMVELLSIPQLSQRRRLLGALLEFYEPGDLGAIHAGMIAREKMGGKFNTEFEMMMERAAEVDGPVVMAKIQKESGQPGSRRHEWQRRCVANYAAVDPEKAVGWWNGLSDGGFRDFLAKPLVEGIGRVDVDRAWEAAKMFEQEQRAQFAPGLAKQFAESRGVEGAVQWVAGLGAEDGAAKAGALRELTEYLHQISPAKQAEMYMQFVNEPWAANSGVFEGVAEQWAKRDGKESAAWAQTLPEEVRGRAAYAAMNRWTSQDPAAAGAWLEGHRGEPTYVAMAGAFLDKLKQRESPEVEAWRVRLGVEQQQTE